PLIASSPFEAHFLFAKTPVTERLQRAASLQARVLRSGFQDVQKHEISDALDRIASDAEARGRLLEAVETKSPNQVEKAIAILRLSTGGMFTEGRLSAKARNLILRHIGQPGFLSGYIAHQKPVQPSAEAATNDLVRSLEKIGITPETGLKTI